MSDSASFFIIQVMMGIIILLLGWGFIMVRGWSQKIDKDQERQWSSITKNSVEIGRLQGRGQMHDPAD